MIVPTRLTGPRPRRSRAFDHSQVSGSQLSGSQVSARVHGRGAAVAHRLAPLLRTAWRVRVHGAAHIPAAGAVIVAGNHVALLDGPVLFVACPRPVHFLVKSEVFTPAVGRVLRAIGQIPVHRGSPDRAALAAALEVLAAGRVLGVFPEGRRGPGDFAAFHHGLAYLALRSGAPIVPAACLTADTRGAEPRIRLAGTVPTVRPYRHVVFGVPFDAAAAQDAARDLPVQDLAAADATHRADGSPPPAARVVMPGIVGGVRRRALLAASERVQARLVDHVRSASRPAPAAPAARAAAARVVPAWLEAPPETHPGEGRPPTSRPLEGTPDA